MAEGLALLICSLIFSLIGLVIIGGIGYITLSFIKTLSPYQFDKLKGRKISNTKIQKVIDEKIIEDEAILMQEPIMLDLFKAFSGTSAYAEEKNAIPNFFTGLIKRYVAPAIPSLVAGTSAQDVAVGGAAQLGADILGSEQGLKTIQGVWEFVKMILAARKNKQIALPQNINKASSNTPIEMETI